MSRTKIGSRLRLHPVRSVGYLLCMIFCILTIWLVRSIASGAQDGLITQLADSPGVRSWVGDNLSLRYSIRSVHVGPGGKGCGVVIEVHGLTLPQVAVGAAQVDIDRMLACSSLYARAESIVIGTRDSPGLLQVGLAAVSWPGEAQIQQIRWNDDKGTILTVGTVHSELPSLKTEIASVGVLPSERGSLVDVSNISTGTFHLHSHSAQLDELRTRGVRLAVEQRSDGSWNFVDLGTRLLPEAQRTVEMTRASLAAGQNSITRVRHLLLLCAVVAAAIVCLLKLLLARWVQSRFWRAVITIGPSLTSVMAYVLLFQSLSFRSFAIIGLLAGVLLAIALWVLQYRRAAALHQRFEPLVVDVVSPLLILVPLALYGSLGLVSLKLPASESLTVSKSTVTEAMARVVSRLCNASNLGDARMDTLDARDLSAVVDLTSLAVRSLALDHAFVHGEASALALPFDKIQYLPSRWKRSPSIVFCANVAVSNRNKSIALPDCRSPDSSGLPTVSAATSVNFTDRTATLSTLIHAARLAFQGSVTGSLTGARIDRLESLPGSTLGLSDASGQTQWKNGQISSQLTLHGIEYAASGARVGVSSVEIAGAIPPPCTSGQMRVAAHLGHTSFASRTGYQVDLEGLDTQFTRSGQNRVSLRAAAHNSRISGSNTQEPSRWLSAEFPFMQFDLRGQTSTEGLVPRGFNGEASALILKADGGPAFRSVSPLKLQADLWSGELNVGDQSAVFVQSIISRIPEAVPVHLSMTAKLDSLGPTIRARTQATAEVSHLMLDALPVSLSLNDLSLHAAWNIPGHPQFAYRSGWNRIDLRLPRAVQLKSVSTLDLKTEGSIKTPPSPKAALDDLRAVADWGRRALPTMPDAIVFRISGASPPTSSQPVLLFITQGGRSVRVQDASASFPRVELRDSHFEVARVDAHAEGITNSQGAGSFRVEAKSTISDQQLTMKLEEPIRATVSVGPSSIALSMDNPTSIGPLTDQLRPLIEEAGLHLDGVHPMGTLASLHSEASFANAKLNGLNVDAALSAGPLLQLDFTQMLAPRSPEFLHTIEIGQMSPFFVTLSAPPASFPDLELKVSAPEISLDVNGGAVETEIAAATQSSLTFIATAPSRPTARLLGAASGFASHLEHAAEVFGDAITHTSDIRWHTEIHRNGDERVVAVDPERIDLSVLSDGNLLSWRSAGVTSTARCSLSLAASLETHSNHLIFDADIPLSLDFSSDGAPERTWNLHLPLLVAFRDRLEPASTNSAELWDSAYYDRLWQSYQVRHATSSLPVLDARQIIFRNISLQQISLPAQPIRLALGYDGPIQIHLPIRSSLLYGSAEGTVQAKISWEAKAAAVDSFTRFLFKDIQAGAVGLALGGAPVPLLEDRLEGNITFRTDGFRVDPSLSGRLTSDASNVTELDKLGIDFNLESERDKDNLPGVLQIQTALRPDLYNPTLNALAQDLLLVAPSQTVRYRNMAVHFAVEKGAVQTQPILVSLQGVQVPEFSPFNIGVDIRVHWGSMAAGFAGQKLRLRNLLYFLQRAIPSQGQE